MHQDDLKSLKRLVSVSIYQCIHFIGCRGNRVNKANHLYLGDSSFQYVHNRYAALSLEDVSTVIILRSMFNSNCHQFNNQHQTLECSSIYHLQRSTDGEMNIQDREMYPGVLQILYSNVLIANSKFINNTADIGGAIVASNSSLYILESIYRQNKALVGRVMATNISTVIIENSLFIENEVSYLGGVIASYTDRYNITGVKFNNNFC